MGTGLYKIKLRRQVRTIVENPGLGNRLQIEPGVQGS